MARSLAWSALVLGLFGTTVALAETASTHPAPVKPHRPKATNAGRSSAAPGTGSDRQLWDSLVKGSPDQQAAERRDNELAGIKPVDHRKDDFFSDWRGLR